MLSHFVVQGATTPVSAAPSDSASITELDGISIVSNTVRTYITDKVQLPTTGDKVRDKSMQMIYTALASNTDVGGFLDHAAIHDVSSCSPFPPPR